jgi:hypothetical protein
MKRGTTMKDNQASGYLNVVGYLLYAVLLFGYLPLER